MKFRTTLLLGIAVLIGGIVAATVIAIGRVLETAAYHTIVDDLARTERVIEDMLRFHQAELRAETRAVAEEPRLKAVMTADVTPATVLGVAQDLRAAIENDILIVTDADGAVIADVRASRDAVTPLRDHPVVRRALATGEASAIWVADRRAFQIQAHRLAFGDTPIGVLVIGNALDDRLLEILHRQTGSEIALDLDGLTIASSTGVDRSLRFELAPDRDPVEIAMGGTRYLAVAAPLATSELLRFDILRDRDRELAPRRALLRTIYLIAAIALAVALVLAFVFADVLSRPIARLTRAVGAGDLRRQATLGGPQELRTLGRSINRMMRDLSAFADRLEERVAERTRELDLANKKLVDDLHERTRLEIELRQAQKLESVGRLAAGVAHEINTPIQFVNDSLTFVAEAWPDLAKLLESYRVAAAGRFAAEEETADLDYLLANAPEALARALDGLSRVKAIVRSLKQFAAPDQQMMMPVDVNEAIRSTLTIAATEYRLVADVETDLEPLPRVTCFAGDVNQAILNIVINAAHAIGDAVAGTRDRGKITIRTRRDGDSVVIAIADTGSGIPPEIRDKIYDPFFTTKEVGRGTGQGLAIARSVVIDKHGGQLAFETEVGTGTTFFIRLPIEGPTRR